MKKRLFVISCIAMCTAFIFSGCNVIKTEISNPITEIFDEGGVDYKSFSEPAQKALYRIYSDHFFEATGINEDNFDDVVEYMKNLFSKITSNSLEISALTNATFEDQIIQYDISTAQANAEAISYAVEKYSNKCAENKIAVKSGVHIYKLASESPEKEVKYNGSDSDLKLFINNVINYEARNGYCYIEINEYGAPVAVYWADKKTVFNNNDNLTSFYRWDIEEYQNGADLIGAYPASFSIVNIATSRIAEKTSVASKFSLSSLDFDEIEAGEVYDNLVEVFKEEIDDWINYFESVDSETSDMSFTKEQFEDMSSSNAYAKQVHSALASCATQAGIYDIKIESAEITNNYDGDTDLLFGDYDPDLESYLGGSFKGYYYVYLNPETYSVYFALWSEQPIPDSYKYQFTEDEQEKLWAKGVKIGCYPYALDSEFALKYSNGNDNDSDLSNLNFVDPFDGLEIQYDGASPYIKASVNTSKCSDNVRNYVTFSVANDSLKKGDRITIKADWDKNAISDAGISYSSESKDYVVNNVAYYLDSLDGVDLSELNQLMDDFIEAEANKAVGNYEIFGRRCVDSHWFNDTCGSWVHSYKLDKINSSKVVREYFCSFKQPTTLDKDKINNKYIRIYEVSYDAHCNSAYSTGTAVIAVFMDNIVMGADGILKYNSTEPLNALQLYYKDGDTISALESNYIIAEKAQYNVTQIN